MVSSINSATTVPAVQAKVASSNARAADGDYKPATAQATSSRAVQAALSILKLGG